MPTTIQSAITPEFVAAALFAYAATLNSQYARRVCRLAELVLAGTTMHGFRIGGYPTEGTVRNALAFVAASAQ